jgi:polar amino acid transport system substrate-binding protein
MGLSRRRFLVSTMLLGAAAAAGCTTTVSGQARPNPVDLRRAQESTPAPGGLDIAHVGIRAFEPYTVGSGADLKGPIPDVARKVLTDLGTADVRFVLLNDQEKILTALAAGQIDVAGGLVLQPQSCHNLSFSVPDFVSGTAFAVPAGNPKGLKTYAEVAAQGAKLAVSTGSPEETDATAAGVPAANIVRIPDPTALLAAVRDGQADCFAFDDVSLRHMVKTQGQGLEVAAAFMPANRPPFVGAYAFPQDSELVEPFNKGLKELHDSGEWLRMVEPFEFTEGNEPPADLTTEKACGE